MNKYQYLNEKFSGAVRSLAISTESLQDRLADAYVHHICHVKDQPMPEEIKEKFDLLCKIFASGVSDMTIEEATSFIDDIIYIAEITTKAYYQV